MKTIYTIIFLGISFISIAVVANGYERGILMNTSDKGNYYQEICPLGPPGTFLMSDPTSPCGASWKEITLAGLPDSPFNVVIVLPQLAAVIPSKISSSTPSTILPAIIGSKTVYLRPEYKLASSTATNLSQ